MHSNVFRAMDDSSDTSAVLEAARHPLRLHRELTRGEVEQLGQQGCTASDWSQVRIVAGCDLRQLRSVHFEGAVKVGRLDGVHTLPGGVRMRSGVFNARLQHVTLGDQVLISNVRRGICNYDVESDVVIVDTDLVAVEGRTSFANGVSVAVVREDGWLAIPMFDGLSSNLAHYLIAAPGEDEQRGLADLVRDYARRVSSTRGRIGRGTRILGAGQILNCRIGPAAEISGAVRVHESSLNSRADSPVFLGAGVQVSECIVSSGSRLDSGVIASRCFIGQRVCLEKQFSAQDSVLGANSHFAHGEACSLLAGPSSHSHHKGTLLIAAEASYFNAGAGTTQCNHAYKTGPIHHGVFERGCKTGAATCIGLPVRVGPFTTILGRHRSGYDTTDFPFSCIVEEEGGTRLIPGLNLLRAGVWRDERKWIGRDQRNAGDTLDCLHHEVMSPWVVDKMRRGRDILAHLFETHAKAPCDVQFAGTRIRFDDLARGLQLYQRAIRRYLGELVVRRLESGRELSTGGATNPSSASDPRQSDWCDAGGMYTPCTRGETLYQQLREGKLATIEAVQECIQQTFREYEQDAWSWCVATWLQEEGCRPEDWDGQQLTGFVAQWKNLAIGFLEEIQEDARRDLAKAAMWIHSPYTTQSNPAPNGDLETFPLVQQIQEQQRTIQVRCETLIQKLLDRAA